MRAPGHGQLLLAELLARMCRPKCGAAQRCCSAFPMAEVSCCLRATDLGLEAPVMTLNGVIFLFFSFLALPVAQA